MDLTHNIIENVSEDINVFLKPLNYEIQSL
jgi:hypothetical protein